MEVYFMFNECWKPVFYTSFTMNFWLCEETLLCVRINKQYNA